MANYLDFVVTVIAATSVIGTGLGASALTGDMSGAIFDRALPPDRVVYAKSACSPANDEVIERALDALGGAAELLSLAAKTGTLAAAVIPEGSACYVLPEDASMPGRNTRVFVAPDGRTFLSLGGQAMAL